MKEIGLFMLLAGITASSPDEDSNGSTSNR